MSDLEHEGHELARIHAKNNDRKYFCHFTGFLEGIVASGFLERGEVEPLIAECKEFVSRISDADAQDIVQDFECDLLEFEALADVIEYRQRKIDSSCSKSALNRFLGYCRGIVCDGVIKYAEAEGIVWYIQCNPELLNNTGVPAIYACCLDALADGILDSSESAEICDTIGFVIGDSYGDTGIAQSFGVANFSEMQLSSLEDDLDGAVVVLTGVFETKPRSVLEDKLAEFGAIITRHISGKTDLLIVGGQASRDWLEMNRGTKIKKAQEMRLSSNSPQFISESQLLRKMGEYP